MLNKLNGSYQYKLALISFLTITFAIVSVNAADNASLKDLSSRQYAAVINNLKQKLENDLATNKVELKISNISESRLATNQIKLAGSALCVLNADDNQLPMNFAVVINNDNNEIVDVTYKFIKLAESASSPSDTEQTLMQEIMTQIHHDYKTDNIVISIDNFETADTAGDKKIFTGYGEVRIGDLSWQKIIFQLTMDDKKTAKNVTYKLK